MDGDVAEVAALADVCRRHGAVLVVDDAHKVFHVADLDDGAFADVVVRVGTLSKTLGALGGFVAGTRVARRPARQPRPLVHLHHCAVAGGHGGRARGSRRRRLG